MSQLPRLAPLHRIQQAHPLIVVDGILALLPSTPRELLDPVEPPGVAQTPAMKVAHVLHVNPKVSVGAHADASITPLLIFE